MIIAKNKPLSPIQRGIIARQSALADAKARGALVIYVPADEGDGGLGSFLNPEGIAAVLAGREIWHERANGNHTRELITEQAIKQSADELGRVPTGKEVVEYGLRVGLFEKNPTFWQATFRPLLETTLAAGAFFAGGAYLANVAAGASGASVGATSAAAPSAASAVGVAPIAEAGAVAATASAPVAGALGGALATTASTAGAGLVTAATTAAGVAIKNALTPPKPSQAAPVAAPAPKETSGLAPLLALAAAGAVLLLPLP